MTEGVLNADKLLIGRFERAAWSDSTGSTNDDLVAVAKSNPKVAAIAGTEEQTAGRGRRDRRWTMRPGGGLMISFYVPWTTRATLTWVASALGVAAVEAARRVANTDMIALKWPNDLVVQGSKGDESDRKMAGMLADAVFDGPNPLGVVVGLGLNVSWPTLADIGENPELAHATSLRQIARHDVDKGALAVNLVAGFEEELTRLETLGHPITRSRYSERCRTMGQRVRVEQPDGELLGTAVDIDQRGHLVVEDDDGSRTDVSVGDVVHLRTP